MSKSRTQKWTQRQRRIAYRLRERHRSPRRPRFSASNIHDDLSDKDRGLAEGGIGALHSLAQRVGLVERIDQQLSRVLGFEDYHYFFHITHDRRGTAVQMVELAPGRCDPENVIEQLKNGVQALKMPVGDLVSTWASRVMASRAWSLKAWFALLLPEAGRWKEKYQREKASVLRMEFKKFVNVLVRVPAQGVRSGRPLRFRLLSWNPWQEVFSKKAWGGGLASSAAVLRRFSDAGSRKSRLVKTANPKKREVTDRTTTT